MSELPRWMRHPGTPDAARVLAHRGIGKTFDLQLAAGMPLLEAVRRGFGEHGFLSGVCDLSGITLARISYCIPALSTTPDHVAFYSGTFRPAGPTRIQRGALTFGERDGAPFFHAHGLWREGDGKIMGGHILSEQTFLAMPAKVSATGIKGALFRASADAETGFTLLSPEPINPLPAALEPTYLLAVRLPPNVDFCTTVERLCAENGLSQARIRGGVGSLIGARFEDGREAPNFATEVFVSEGKIERDREGKLAAIVDVGLIDYQAMIHEGRLKRGDNPVLITFELILEADSLEAG